MQLSTRYSKRYNLHFMHDKRTGMEQSEEELTKVKQQAASKGQKIADELHFDELSTRKQLIDLQLTQAGWDVCNTDQVALEEKVYPLRKLYGFYSKSRLRYQVRQRTERKPLNSVSANAVILGDRQYQHEALKRISERFESKQRKALAVQATGTGKTRLSIALTDVCMKAGWVKGQGSNDQLTSAISVDMLDMCIDVPEIVNLVFARPVKSPVKFWQMIGRGTRLCLNLFGPGKHKTHFQIFDHWGVVEFHGMKQREVAISQPKSLMQRLFETRLILAKTALHHAEPDFFDCYLVPTRCVGTHAFRAAVFCSTRRVETAFPRGAWERENRSIPLVCRTYSYRSKPLLRQTWKETPKQDLVLARAMAEGGKQKPEPVFSGSHAPAWEPVLTALAVSYAALDRG